MDKSHEFTGIGKSVPIKDAKEKVTGSLEYAIDHCVPNMVYGKILRSPHAHAKIKSIDTSRAEALEGFLGIVSHEDAPDWDWEAPSDNYKGRILDDKARYVGDEVAAVAAISEEIAARALELIHVEYELLPAVFDPEEAMEADAPQVRLEGNMREPGKVIWGDVEQGVGEADVVAEGSMKFESQQHAPIGRNACIVEWDGDQVSMWTSTQTPSECQTAVAMAFRIPTNNVRVIGLPSGCSFGLWWVNNFHLLTALLAKKIAQPVKVELNQEECFAGVKRRHLENCTGRVGCKKDGTLVFLDVESIFDNGGYGYKDTSFWVFPDLWGRTPHVRFVGKGSVTNLVTAGCMRGVGDVTLGAFIERLLDMAAIKLDMDPLKFRLKNHTRSGDELLSMRSFLDKDLFDSLEEPICLSSDALHECMEQGAQAFEWNEKWKGWGVPYAIDGPKRLGVGMAAGVCVNGDDARGDVSALVRVHQDGSATLFCSMGRIGQGSETTQAQIAAETLGMSIDQIRVEAGDTLATPWSHGSAASNTACRTGFASMSACLDAKGQILDIASKYIFENDPSELDIREDRIYQKRDPSKSVPLRELMSRPMPDTFCPPVIIGRPVKRMPNSFAIRNYGVHFVEVEVDTETGKISIINYVAAQDSGTVLNPKVVENQVIGGAILSSGFALVESLAFDPQTGRILNPGFMDYKVFRAPDFPLQPTTILCEPYDPVGPYGVKGAGEVPANVPIPAISQAVYNAIGVWLDVPMTPQRVLSALGKI